MRFQSVSVLRNTVQGSSHSRPDRRYGDLGLVNKGVLSMATL